VSGPEQGEEPEETHGVPRIPGPRAAGDNLDPPRLLPGVPTPRSRPGHSATPPAHAPPRTGGGGGADADGTTAEAREAPVNPATAGVAGGPGAVPAAHGSDADGARAESEADTDTDADTDTGGAGTGTAGSTGNAAPAGGPAGTDTAAGAAEPDETARTDEAAEADEAASTAGAVAPPAVPGPATAHRPAVPVSGPGPVSGMGSGSAPEAGAGSAAALGSHAVLKSLLGAWALTACSAEETEAVELHLGDCAVCAEEALRLRDAVELLHTERELDLDPQLRFRVLANCLGRRPPRIPVPEWAAPYDAETARLDALLRDINDDDWQLPVRLRWYDGEEPAGRDTTVAGVIGHLLSVDGLVAGSLGLDDPLGLQAPRAPGERTEKFWRAEYHPGGRGVHQPWRDQSHGLIRTASFAGGSMAGLSVSYGGFSLPLRDSLLDRAFECWMHADDIASAVDYPYPPPRGTHLKGMIDLAARLLPAALAARRRKGLASPAKQLVRAGSPGRSLRLEVEGPGGGDWYIALDSPAALGSPDRTVAQVALEGVEFCKLVAGHMDPAEAAAGQDGDREAIREVLFAAASLSRL
jgi:hypothetical protein